MAIAGNQITRAKIVADAIDGTKVADDTLDSEHYIAASIDNEHLADNAVGTDEIAADAVTYAKIQNVSATDRILGRDSASAGIIEEIAPSAVRTMINVADGANAYVHPNHSGEVTSTADGATVIAGNIVDEANLKVSNAPTNGYFLSAQSGDTGGMTWAAAGGGKVLQVVTTQTGAFASGTTTVPIDNTIMQITEGDEYMSLAITPTSATSRLFIQVQALLSSSALGFITGSIFQDTTAGALATSLAMQTDAVRQPRVLPLNHNMVAGTTSATTFKFRAGLQISNTTYFNGTASQLWGGVGASSITITEYTP